MKNSWVLHYWMILRSCMNKITYCKTNRFLLKTESNFLWYFYMWIFLSRLTDQRFTRYYFCKLDQNLKKLVTTNPWKNLYNSLHTNSVFELNTHIKLVCSAKIHFQAWSSYRFCNNVCLNVKSKCLKKFCFEGCFSHGQV